MPLGGGLFTFQTEFCRLTASIETDICFVEATSEKDLPPELYLK